MARKRTFPLGAILTVLHKAHFTDEDDQVNELLAFLIGSDVYLYMDCISMSAVVQESAALRQQLPKLYQATRPPASFPSEMAAHAWVSQMAVQHGAFVEVEPTHPRRRRR